MDDTQDVIALLYLMKNVKLKQDCSQSHLVVELPAHLARAAGILKYMRESTDHGLVFDIQTENPSEYQVKCEYCGQELSPSLNELCLHGPEAVLFFCCEQWEHLCRLLLKMRNVWEGKSDDIPAANDNSVSKDLVYRRKKEKLSMFLVEPTKEVVSEPKLFEEYLIEMPAHDTGTVGSKIRSFRLSCPTNGSWVRLPENELKGKANVLDTSIYKDDITVSICNHEPLDFGLCHHQDGGDFIKKYYTDGLKFLLVFDDGSAQVFYPSGLLAILVIVTSHGRVCIVYDDAPGQPIKALFQSDGKGTCYHPNGNIWLIMNKYEGQCLDPGGARIRRWTWHKLGSAPLRPIFLCINKSIGIRVLGMQQIFVSFLANGRQAKFNVGAWCHKGICKEVKTPLGLAKDELIAQAARVKTRLLIQKCHLYMCTSSQPKVSNAALAPRLHLLAQKLLSTGKNVNMGEEDSEFFNSCLQDCL